MDKALLSEYQLMKFNTFQMTQTLNKGRLYPDENTFEIEAELNITKRNLPRNLQLIENN